MLDSVLGTRIAKKGSQRRSSHPGSPAPQKNDPEPLTWFPTWWGGT